MSEPVEPASGHAWTRWKYDRTRRRWYRHCIASTGLCTAAQSVPRGMKPKGER